MAAYYGLFLTIHILCAITFIGAVFFEVLVIEPIEKRLPPGLAEALVEEIPKQVRKFMPYVVALLFLTNGNDAGTLSLYIMPPIDDASWTIGDAVAGGVQQIVLVGAVLALLLSRRSPVRLRGAPEEHQTAAAASAAE